MYGNAGLSELRGDVLKAPGRVARPLTHAASVTAKRYALTLPDTRRDAGRIPLIRMAITRRGGDIY